MKLDLTQIRQAETPFTATYAAGELAAADQEYVVTDPVVLVMTIHKDKERFRLAGVVRTTLELACSRCVEPYALSVEQAFDLRYVPQKDAGDFVEREIDADDMSVAFYEEDAIDVRQLIEEQLYLALPMKPLCRPECRGLCGTCGKNLNQDVCGCTDVWMDPRLEALKTLISTDRKNDDA
jgi:uncharacterized protein